MKPMLKLQCTSEKRWVTTTDGKKMLVWVILPPNFDKTKNIQRFVLSRWATK